ncbi:DMT family transporter [Teredinibacter purpureus]|uniref:DMT family transporter n=1 Tax=Teredinibacter purpureus TaxID=2731756 RepID=UPI0005F78172|nr:DMT family transporter [Teredinibacter purpureus]
MPVILAYIFVVFIWATTPLAIQWSNSSLAFVTSVSLRMVFALVICATLLAILNIRLIEKRSDWWAFLVGMIGLYPNMLIIYWAAQYISSGLMAVILGLYPFAVGFFSLIFTKENVFNPARIVALGIAVGGLYVLHYDQIALGHDAVLGVLGMVASSILFAFSSVLVKLVGGGVGPLRQSTGVLVLSAPAFVITWFFLDGEIPTDIDTKSIMGLSYLSVAGSVIGHTLFFYVLRHCSMVSVSLIPLLTPVLALSIGAVFAQEVITFKTIIGSAMVLFSLGLYQGVFQTIGAGIKNIRITHGGLWAVVTRGKAH